MQFLGHYDRSFPSKRSGLFCKKENNNLGGRIVHWPSFAEFPRRGCSTDSPLLPFLCRMTVSLGSTLRGQSSFLIFEHEETNNMSIDWRAGVGWCDYRLRSRCYSRFARGQFSGDKVVSKSGGARKWAGANGNWV